MEQVVIKVKYGDVLRRFRAHVVDEKLDLTFNGLRDKISSLFNFSTHTDDLDLTYLDDDNNDVTMADDEDLHDVVRQGLDPVRITVKCKTDILDLEKLSLSYLEHSNAKRTEQPDINSEPAFMDNRTLDCFSHADMRFLYATCYGCAMHPIAWPWFKSKKLKDGYDLCSSCFYRMGKAEDYIKMNFPAAEWTIMLPKESSSGVLFNSCLISGVGIMVPLTPFTKIWRLRNNGMTVWPEKTKLVWVGGDQLCKEVSFELEIPKAGIMVDQVLDVTVDLVAPELPGQYVSYFQMSSPSGEMFGQHIRVLIQVIPSLKGNELDAPNSFDLNSTPAHNTANGLDPMAEDNLHFSPPPLNLPGSSWFRSMFNPAGSTFPPPPPNQAWYPPVFNRVLPSQLTQRGPCSYQPHFKCEMERIKSEHLLGPLLGQGRRAHTLSPCYSTGGYGVNKILMKKTKKNNNGSIKRHD